MKQYEYAEDILKIIGFKHLADYETMVSYDEIDQDALDAVNDKMLSFKQRFKLRDFNLARYKYIIPSCAQLISFIRKVLSKLDIPHEVFRHNGKNVMRLKPENKMLKVHKVKKCRQVVNY